MLTLSRVRILCREGLGEELGAAVRLLIADRDSDIRRYAREELPRLGALLPESSRASLTDDLIGALRTRSDGREAAEALGGMAVAVPASKRPAVVDALVRVASRGGEDAGPATAALSRLAPYAGAEAGRIRDALIEAAGSGAAEEDPEEVERTYAPLSFAPAVADGAFVSAMLRLTEDRDAATRLRATVILEAIRPAVRLTSLPRCFAALFRCLADRDPGVREHAAETLFHYLLVLPALPQRTQVKLVGRVARAVGHLDSGQRMTLMLSAHTLGEVLPSSMKEIIIESLLADSQRADPREVGYAIHTAAALAIGCRTGTVKRIASRVSDVGRKGHEDARGAASEAWGDLLGIESKSLRRAAVKELLRLAEAGVRSALGDPWSMLETNREVLPPETAGDLVQAFLRAATVPGKETDLGDAAGVVIELAHRMPGSLADLAPESAREAALKALLASKAVDLGVPDAIRALGALAHVLPPDRKAVVVERLGSLIETLPARRQTDEDEEVGGGPGRHAVALALSDLLPSMPSPLRRAIVGRLERLGSGTRPDPDALKGLAMGGDEVVRASAIDRLLRVAVGRGREDVRVGATWALGEISDVAGPRLPEIADALLTLLDEPSDTSEYGLRPAIKALPPVYRRLPAKRSAILSRLMEAVEEDGDSDAAIALAELGPDIPEESRGRVLETLERACRDAAGTRDEWRFARAVRESARHLAPERRGEVERSVRAG